MVFPSMSEGKNKCIDMQVGGQQDQKPLMVILDAKVAQDVRGFNTSSGVDEGISGVDDSMPTNGLDGGGDIGDLDKPLAGAAQGRGCVPSLKLKFNANSSFAAPIITGGGGNPIPTIVSLAIDPSSSSLAPHLEASVGVERCKVDSDGSQTGQTNTAAIVDYAGFHNFNEFYRHDNHEDVGNELDNSVSSASSGFFGSANLSFHAIATPPPPILPERQIRSVDIPYVQSLSVAFDRRLDDGMRKAYSDFIPNCKPEDRFRFNGLYCGLKRRYSDVNRPALDLDKMRCFRYKDDGDGGEIKAACGREASDDDSDNCEAGDKKRTCKGEKIDSLLSYNINDDTDSDDDEVSRISIQASLP